MCRETSRPTKVERGKWSKKCGVTGAYALRKSNPDSRGGKSLRVVTATIISVRQRMKNEACNNKLE